MALTTITKDFIVKSGLTVEGTSSVSTSTAGAGTLSVKGGASVAGNIIVGSTATLYGPTTLQNILNVSGDVTVGGGNTVINASSGDIYSSGALGIGGAFNSTGTLSVNTTLFTVDGATGNVVTQGTSYTAGDAGFNGNVVTTGTTTVLNATSATGLYSAPVAGDAALVVMGGTKIGENLLVGSNRNFDQEGVIVDNTTAALSIYGGMYLEGSATFENGTNAFAGPSGYNDPASVSYTHLTLPTIYSV